MKNKFIKLGRRQLYKYSNARGKIRLGLTALVKQKKKKKLNKELLCQTTDKLTTAKIN